MFSGRSIRFSLLLGVRRLVGVLVFSCSFILFSSSVILDSSCSTESCLTLRFSIIS
jgi:hypothetical protein